MSEFNMAVKESYTYEEWEQREQWYLQKVGEIQMPIGPTPQDLENFANQVERVLSIARFDWAYAKRASDRFDMLYKTQKLVLFNKLVQEGMVKADAKVTVDEKKGYVEELMQKPFKSYGKSLAELVSDSNDRIIFMDTVINALEDKKSLIMSHASAMKTEASLNNFSSSVPRN